jgi:hypothetical protein
MSKDNPVKDPGFQRTLRNLLAAPPKRQADMKLGTTKVISKKEKPASGVKRGPKKDRDG